MSIYGHWNRGLVLIISAFLLSFSFAVSAELPEESLEDMASKMEESSEETSSNKNLKCDIEDDVFGCWMAVENKEDCESGTTAYQTDESDQLLCLISEESIKETEAPTNEESSEETSSNKNLKCVVEDEVLGCWMAVENEKDCESGTTAYQTDESDQLLCLISDN